MSGHSKYANIKHRKEKADGIRGKIFTKLGREIAVAVKLGGADPEANSKLRDAIAKAKANNLPNDNIARSIKKASGEMGDNQYTENVYEGYGPSGVAVIVETMTNNRNRTASDMRHYFDKFGGNLGTTGCVSFMFEKRGVIIIDREKADEDTLMLDALDAGAEDFTAEQDYYEILTDPNLLNQVRDTLLEKGYTFESADVDRIPQTSTTLTDEKDILLMQKLIDHLEDNDDVQNVYHNWEE
ncbi:MAG: YebC/PmpR family DNA-binding transcriptional regulator [Hyphomonadaceae bacterium]|nr:YebC/PmpR family DNA-binding transcriptional regulator [Clostridia bacterium]